ncbi:MAG: hypothetical protein QOI88_1816 [Gammaproteobacteria bacterium]|nr:hypothetical protein [Gammaproteobacteria bacterium]
MPQYPERRSVRGVARFAAACVGLLAAACSGGPSVTSSAMGASTSAATPAAVTPAATPATPPASTPATVGSVSPTSTAGGGPAARLATKLGKPARLLVGLGTQGAGVNAVSAIESQALKIDIYERYLGAGDWTGWNSPPCDYVCVVGAAADSIGAVPMYTQYQMANNGDGNLAVVNDAAFMKTYWTRVKQMFESIAAYGKPALVNLEPDFWGYVERHAPGGDPTKMTAIVSSNPDCATLHNNVAGLAGCLVNMGRKYAPKAYIGFPPSSWGGNTTAEVVAFMRALGAQTADFIVEQTSDRDAGCFELQASGCSRSGSGWYWDESNKTHPNFHDHLAEAQAFHVGIGNLPLIWWQTPLGVPSVTRGGTAFHYRDNRAHYFLTHPAELVAAGGLGVVFSTGANYQTSITTDAGEFQELDNAYLRSPAKLP